MQTGENSMKEAHLIIVTRIYSALVCSKIQVYGVMIEYNN